MQTQQYSHLWRPGGKRGVTFTITLKIKGVTQLSVHSVQEHDSKQTVRFEVKGHVSDSEDLR